ncbi:trypsin, alkaline C-like [Anticarsia gemmatalis]|uniref:trypsin, alkaline C-like n=1 Tax=Anticarsia gemmatalis TaxID=129554 RepID=UPI003F764EB6
MRVVIVLALFYAAVSAVPLNSQRIVGGTVTTIDNYPSMVAVLESFQGQNYRHVCGGTIMNQRTILSAAHCFNPLNPVNFRMRVGSTMANSGGIVHTVNNILIHPDYAVVEHDLALVRVASLIVYSNYVQPVPIAGPNYALVGDEVVWATGWGATSFMGPWSEQLRHVQVWTISHEVCNERMGVSENQLCTGWLDVGGRDQCQGDSGGPVYHNGVVVGVTSYGIGCASPRFPGVNVRVSRYATWIQANA